MEGVKGNLFPLRVWAAPKVFGVWGVPQQAHLGTKCTACQRFRHADILGNPLIEYIGMTQMVHLMEGRLIDFGISTRLE